MDSVGNNASMVKSIFSAVSSLVMTQYWSVSVPVPQVVAMVMMGAATWTGLRPPLPTSA